MFKFFSWAMLALVLAAPGCGDKVDPVEVDVPTPEDTTTTGTTTTGTTTGGTTAGGTTTGGSTTAGSTSAGTTTAGSTTGTTSGGAAASGLCGTNATTLGYAAYASTVIKANCTSCHAPGKSKSDSPLDTYANAKSTFQSGNGKSRVDSGNMPLTGKMDSKSICIIDAWVDGGYQP